ncbi:MATE family efflux transporter [Loigolactobacillus bifermentans]|uniref:Na+-driven multidrug efflux pump n=1 Tax=Loigolactobacillus bifermentans DSM 20003 TaxID=1423726 RepID=A0A0R1GP49_9LACO|nr:MATE family efflux transporter [Loigolactobacillus bifermentans]KRK34195.1 Na+-driven multidrug efflux pump [Loigolactobacillus bifermentans DSM 20003]
MFDFFGVEMRGILHSLTTGSPIKRVVLFTIPLLIGNLFQQLYSFMDALIVGRTIGKNALAAVGATGSINFLIIGFAQGITTGLSVLTAQAYGARDERGVRKSFGTSVWISLGLTVVLTVVSVAMTRPLLTLMQTPPAIIDQSVAFVRVIFIGVAAAMAFNLLSNMMRALGDSRTPLFFLIIATILNIILELIFILVFHWGVAGAGWATVTAQFCSAILCWLYIKRHIPMLVLRRQDMGLDWAAIRRHINVGLPMGFSMSIIAIGAVILQVMLNTLGTNAVAAYTAAGRIDQLATLPASSFGLAMATFAAQNLGARQFGRIRKGVHQTLVLNVTVSAILGLLIITFGQPLVNLFLGPKQPAVTALAQTYFHFNASMYWLLAILFTMRNLLQGLGKTMVPTVAGLFELLMRAFAGLVLVTHFGFAGASMANPLAWLGSVFVLINVYFHTMKQIRQREAAQQQRSD